MISLNEDGTVSGAAAGTWERKEGTYYMSLTCDDVVYSGVFCQMRHGHSKTAHTQSRAYGMTHRSIARCSSDSTGMVGR